MMIKPWNTDVKNKNLHYRTAPTKLGLCKHNLMIEKGKHLTIEKQ